MDDLCSMRIQSRKRTGILPRPHFVIKYFDLAICGETTMQISVVIQPIGNARFRASSSVPVSLSAEGATPDEAIQELRNVLKARIPNAGEILALEISEHPLARFAGMFQNDPMFEQWQHAIEEYRRRADEAEEQSVE
jgi:hypothetical protein